MDETLNKPGSNLVPAGLFSVEISQVPFGSVPAVVFRQFQDIQHLSGAPHPLDVAVVPLLLSLRCKYAPALLLAPAISVFLTTAIQNNF